ncbi:FHA domain-containing protein [Georgenia sp. Z1344]|uniref:FHA domain-containing protein n=1 Tax=Georgenia sp. Z1344 TaxID=3416706 RepID=UPI003CF2074F
MPRSTTAVRRAAHPSAIARDWATFSSVLMQRQTALRDLYPAATSVPRALGALLALALAVGGSLVLRPGIAGEPWGPLQAPVLLVVGIVLVLGAAVLAILLMRSGNPVIAGTLAWAVLPTVVTEDGRRQRRAGQLTARQHEAVQEVGRLLAPGPVRLRQVGAALAILATVAATAFAVGPVIEQTRAYANDATLGAMVAALIRAVACWWLAIAAGLGAWRLTVARNGGLGPGGLGARVWTLRRAGVDVTDTSGAQPADDRRGADWSDDGPGLATQVAGVDAHGERHHGYGSGGPGAYGQHGGPSGPGGYGGGDGPGGPEQYGYGPHGGYAGAGQEAPGHRGADGGPGQGGYGGPAPAGYGYGGPGSDGSGAGGYGGPGSDGSGAGGYGGPGQGGRGAQDGHDRQAYDQHAYGEHAYGREPRPGQGVPPVDPRGATPEGAFSPDASGEGYVHQGDDPGGDSAPVATGAHAAFGAHSAPSWRETGEWEEVPDVRVGGYLLDGGITLVGRDPEPRAGELVDNLMVVPDPSMSKTHLSVRLTGSQLHAIDRDSTNGTFYVAEDGTVTKLDPWREVVVPEGAALRVGDSLLEWDDPWSEDEDDAGQTILR